MKNWAPISKLTMDGRLVEYLQPTGNICQAEAVEVPLPVSDAIFLPRIWREIEAA